MQSMCQCANVPMCQFKGTSAKQRLTIYGPQFRRTNMAAVDLASYQDHFLYFHRTHHCQLH